MGGPRRPHWDTETTTSRDEREKRPPAPQAEKGGIRAITPFHQIGKRKA